MAKAIAEMTAAELAQHIADLEDEHRREMKHLKALLRCLPGGDKLLEKKSESK
jgi:hypothetical protein